MDSSLSLQMAGSSKVVRFFLGDWVRRGRAASAALERVAAIPSLGLAVLFTVSITIARVGVAACPPGREMPRSCRPQALALVTSAVFGRPHDFSTRNTRAGERSQAVPRLNKIPDSNGQFKDVSEV